MHWMAPFLLLIWLQKQKKKAIRQVSRNVKDQSVKMIYFDIDGTLREENSEITEKTKYAIRECKRQGILTCICTGRNMGSIQKDVQELQMDGMISGGGASIRYRGQELERKTFPDKWLEEVGIYISNILNNKRKKSSFSVQILSTFAFFPTKYSLFFT